MSAAVPIAAASDPGWLGHLGVTALVALLPFVVIACTSFAKISVVLAILRSALGATGVPPASVIAALAAVLSIFLMAPVGADIAASVEEAAALPREDAADDHDRWGVGEARDLWAAASPPLLDFLRANTPRSEVEYFRDLAGEPAGAEEGLRVMMPAFATSEIVEAFLIGFLVFVPFLVIDLITGTTLLALGMHMMPPAAVSLPLKLLLFVAVDGWHVLVSGLAVSYGT